VRGEPKRAEESKVVSRKGRKSPGNCHPHQVEGSAVGEERAHEETHYVVRRGKDLRGAEILESETLGERGEGGRRSKANIKKIETQGAFLHNW